MMVHIMQSRVLLVALALAFFVIGASPTELDLSIRASAPAPVVVEPSQQWEGNDGPWSSFVLQVGTPSQQVRTFVSIGGQETWVVLPEGCPDSAPSVEECPDLRGGLLNYNDSSTWQSTTEIWDNTGLYALATLVLMNLGIDGNGMYGFDTVGLSFNGAGGVSLSHTVVAGIATSNSYLGQFGVSPRPVNFTVENGNSSSLNDPQPSFFSLLKSNDIIPSLTYSFTAGSFARSKTKKNALGSMVFGGYDASLNGSSVSFDFAENAGRELIVAVQSITKTAGNTDADLLPTGILAVLDSSQPSIWLPVESCQSFENAFGLSWNETAEMYMLNSTLHDTLVAENANVTFRLGNTLSGGSTVDIVFPYSAFDLTASWPLASDSQPYFPLKRAANDTQYTLGRAFMQEAYLIADYEENSFQLSQRRWDDDAESSIVPIRPPASTNGISLTPGASNSKSTLSIGAIVGVVVGAVALSAIIAIATYLRCRRRRRSTAPPPEHLSELDIHSVSKSGGAVYGSELPSEGADVSELEPAKVYGAELPGDVEHRVEIDGLQKTAEVDGLQMVAEADSSQTIVEIDGMERAAEMDGEGRRSEVDELPGSLAHQSG